MGSVVIQSTLHSSGNNHPQHGAHNVQISSEQLKSLAQTVASLEGQAEGNGKQQQPIQKVIDQLMSQGRAAESRAQMERMKGQETQQNVSALGISLEMDPHPGGILDRLETKFSSSTPHKSDLGAGGTSSSTAGGSQLEANLAKAYSHFLTASETRKRDSSSIHDMDGAEDGSEAGTPKKKPVRKTFEIGLGVSLDIDYDASLTLPKEEDTRHNSSFEDNSSQHLSPQRYSGRVVYSPPLTQNYEDSSSWSRYHNDLYGSSRGPITRQGGTADNNRSLSRYALLEDDPFQASGVSSNRPPPFSPSRGHEPPFAAARHEMHRKSPSPPHMDANLDDDFDRRSSSPEAPAPILDDNDETGNNTSKISNHLSSSSMMGRNQQGNSSFDDDTRGGEESPPPFGAPPPSNSSTTRQPFEYNRGLSNSSQSGPPAAPERKKELILWCRVRNGPASAPCNHRSIGVSPDYYEHCKEMHNNKAAGIPCPEMLPKPKTKCYYKAPGAEQMLNHIKAKHDIASTDDNNPIT